MRRWARPPWPTLWLTISRTAATELLLGGVDEGAGVDDQDVGVGGVGCNLGAGEVEQAHHDFRVDEVFGAAEGDEADLDRRFGGDWKGCFNGMDGTRHKL